MAAIFRDTHTTLNRPLDFATGGVRSVDFCIGRTVHWQRTALFASRPFDRTTEQGRKRVTGCAGREGEVEKTASVLIIPRCPVTPRNCLSDFERPVRTTAVQKRTLKRLFHHTDRQNVLLSTYIPFV